jgi:hypothetical protein
VYSSAVPERKSSTVNEEAEVKVEAKEYTEAGGPPYCNPAYHDPDGTPADSIRSMY